MVVRMVFRMFLLFASVKAFVRGADLANESCKANCANVEIPYPFGIGAGCYLNDWFAIDCNSSSSKLFLSFNQLEVLNFSLLQGTIHVKLPIFSTCAGNAGEVSSTNLTGSPFVFSQSTNRYVAVGNNNFVSILNASDRTPIGGCMSSCENETAVTTNGSSCNGINCCQTLIPPDLSVFIARIDPLNIAESYSKEAGCKYSFLVAQEWLDVNSIDPSQLKNMPSLPVVLDWGLSATDISHVMGINLSNNTSTYLCANRSKSTGNMSFTYTCSCKQGFQGNPYLPQGCTGKLLAVY